MTATQMNVALQREMSYIVADETLMERSLKMLRRLRRERKKELQLDPTLMTKEEFYANIDEAEQQLARGEGRTFTNLDDMNNWLNSL